MRLIITYVIMVFALLACSQEKNPVVDRIVSQYEFDCQIELNPLRKEFMKFSNTKEDRLRIVAARDSILSNYAYKPKTKWLEHSSGVMFTEELIYLIYTDKSAPMNLVYDRIEELKKYQ